MLETTDGEGMPEPNIVILEAYTTNPGDLSWDAIRRLGNLTTYDRTPEDALAQRVSEAEVVVSNKILWSRKRLAEAPRCRMIQLLSTGYNVVDYEAANERGITVCNVPAYSTPDVVQHAFALILETTNRVGRYSESVRAGNWAESQDFTYYMDPLSEIAGKTMGIVGMGSIGSAVARVAQAFGMRVLFQNPHPKPQFESASCKQVEIDELLAESDIVSLHCPSTPSNKGMVDREFLSKMKKGARLVNTARGALVASQDVADALASGRLSWYAADVAEHEPMPDDDPLRTAEHAVITPHVAWATKEARGRLIDVAAENIRRYLAGSPQNVVNP